MCEASRYAATFYDEVKELVDVEEIIKENKHKPMWLSGFKDAVGRKHTVVGALEGKKSSSA